MDNLPDEVLLEIFDFYQQSLQDQPSYERVWNNRKGWFKLVRVCHNWRSVVLASPSRLQVRLHFTHNSPTRAVVLKRLSHLPIISTMSMPTGTPVYWRAWFLRSDILIVCVGLQLGQAGNSICKSTPKLSPKRWISLSLHWRALKFTIWTDVTS